MRLANLVHSEDDGGRLIYEDLLISQADGMLQPYRGSR